jgi:hypothetical protein
MQDLEQLAMLFGEGTVRVSAQGDRFWMASNAIDLIEDAGEAYGEAEGLLKTVNGASVLRVQNTGLVRLGSMRRIDKGRDDIYVVPQSARLTMRTGIVKVLIDGKPIPAQEGRILVAADQDPNLEQVLRLYGSREPDWRDLFFILEALEDGIAKTAAAAGWMTESQRKRFTATANNRRVIGDDARHGHAKFEPPTNPMTLEEARALIEETVRQWIHSKLL